MRYLCICTGGYILTLSRTSAPKGAGVMRNDVSVLIRLHLNGFDSINSKLHSRGDLTIYKKLKKTYCRSTAIYTRNGQAKMLRFSGMSLANVTKLGMLPHKALLTLHIKF